ncbi:chromate transporter [Candidatus Gottesmanbacteria bacterium]|nr:chromate transporter [Candidatus Gottesmanbacteria bacterium]
MANKSPQLNLSSLEDVLNEYLGKKAPQLPGNVKEALVTYAPWITLVLLLLSLPAVLVLFGVGALAMPFSYMGGVQYGTTYTISLVILAGTLILEGLAIPGLMKRKKSAWNLVFYATLLGIVSHLLSYNLGNLLLGALLPLYILFQIRSYYK